MHKSIGRRAGAVLAAAVASAAFGAPAANAAGLTACGGGITDPSGDGFRYSAPLVVELAEQAPHYDITETFFTHGDGVLKAQIKVTDMKAEPDDTWWPTWSVSFDVGDVSYEANARMIDGSMAFYYWKFDGRPDQNTGFPIAGEVVDGPGGGVILEIPSDNIDGYSAGISLTEVFAYTQDGQVAGATPHDYSDRAPDSDTSTAKAAECSTSTPENKQPDVKNDAPPSGGTPPPSSGDQAPAGDAPPAPATTAANTGPAVKPGAKKRKKASCVRKAKKIKNKAKKRKALARCKAAAKKKKRAKKRS